MDSSTDNDSMDVYEPFDQNHEDNNMSSSSSSSDLGSQEFVIDNLLNGSILQIHPKLKLDENFKININEIRARTKYDQKIIDVPNSRSEFILHKIKGIQFEYFSHLFMFNINENESENQSKILYILRSKTEGLAKSRPLIVQFSSENNVVYYKNVLDQDFIPFNSTNQNSEFQRNFNTLLAIGNNFDNIFGKIVDNSDSLIVRFLKLFTLEDNFSHKLMYKLAEKGNIDQFTAALDIPFNYESENIYGNSLNILMKTFERNESILKSAVVGNNFEVIDFLLDCSKYYLERLPYDHKLLIVNRSTNDDILFKILINLNFPFSEKWKSFANYQNDNSIDIQRNQVEFNEQSHSYIAAQRHIESQIHNEILNENIDNSQHEDDVSHVSMRNLIRIRNGFHDYIKTGNLEKIKHSSTNFEYTNIIFNSNNQSAITTALKCKQFEIYSYLKNNKFDLNSHEFEECKIIQNHLDVEAKEIIINFNIKYAAKSSHNPVSELGKKSEVCFPKSKNHEKHCRAKIDEFFEELYKDEQLRIILDIASKCQDLKIYFDFNHYSVNEMNPFADETIDGAFHRYRRILFISAGDALNNDGIKHKVKGVLIHEMFHFVLLNVFDNNCLPYYQNDTQSASTLKSILEKYRRWSYETTDINENFEDDECDGIIQYVYTCYNPNIKDLQDLELIVRPAQIIAQYNNDNGKLSKLVNKYRKIFKFYNNLIPEMKIFDNYLLNYEKVNELNKIFGVLQEIKCSPLQFKIYQNINPKNDILILNSDVPTLTMINLHQLLKNDNKNLYIIPKMLRNNQICKRICEIMEENKQNDNKLLEINDTGSSRNFYQKDPLVRLVINYKPDNDVLLKNFLQKCEPKKLIFVTSTENIDPLNNLIKELKTYAEHLILSLQDRFLMNNKYIVENKSKFLQRLNQITTIPMKHKFEDLTEFCQQNLLEKVVKFQGHDEVKLSELILSPNKGNIIDTELLNQLCDNHSIQINSILFPQVEHSFKNLYQSRNIIKKQYIEEIITNPEHEFNNEDDFENLDKVIELKHVESIIKQNELINDENMFVLISDIAGNGKSWLLKDIANQMINTSHDRWTIFLILKDIHEKLLVINGDINFTNFIKHFIMTEENFKEYEKEIFIECYKTGRANIFLDGYDKIYPELAENLNKLIKTFQSNCGNRLWLTTRNHSNIEKELQKILNIKTIYSLKTFTDNQCEEILEKLLASNENDLKNRGLLIKKKNEKIVYPSFNTSDNQEEEIENLSTKIKSTNLLNTEQSNNKENEFNVGASTSGQILVKRKIDPVSNHETAINLLARFKNIKVKSTIGMPLLLKFAAQYYTIDQLNNKKSRIEMTNFILYNGIRSLHEKDWTKKFDHLNQKESLTFSEAHQFYTMQYYFNEDKFCDLKYQNNETRKKVENGGLATFSGNRINFHHETFLEFFAADFIVRLIENKRWEDYKDFFKFFNEFLTNYKYNVVQSFIDDKIDDIISELGENFENFFDKFLKNFYELNEAQRRKIFAYAIIEKNENLINFLLKGFNDEENKNLIPLFSIKFNRLFYNPINIVIYSVIKSSNKSSLILDFIIKKFDADTLKNFITSNELLHDIVTSHCEPQNLQLILNLLKNKLDDNYIKEILIAKNFKGCNLLLVQCTANNFDKKTFNNSWEILKRVLERESEFEDFLFKTNNKGATILHKAVTSNDSYCFKTVYKKLNSHLNEADMKKMLRMKCPIFKSRTFLHLCAFFKSFDFHQTVWKLLKYRDDFYKIMLIPDENGNNFLHLIVAFSNKLVIEFTFNQIKINFLSRYSEFLSIKGFNGRNLLQCAVTRQRQIFALEYMCEFFRHEFGDGDFLDILEQRDENGDNLICTIIAFSSVEVFDFMINYIKEHYPNCVKILLKTENDKYEMNLLELAVMHNKSIELHKYLWKIIKDNFDRNEIIRMIENRHRFGCRLLHFAANKNSKEIVEFTYNKMKEYLNDLSRIIRKRCYQGTLCENASLNDYDRTVVECVNQLL
ncbi:hypothetical protein PVAND_014513 [Polypedilum vanderplanki]|uniref:Ankyrin repeat protein n=1 Tax=Polypedilum vanderplanki TaxID=319348 RepID=A0A9J6B9E1_POLVA|nr:hypothetical protein PVAND_014513 [Polypedilum vanderplanki]